MVLHPSFQNKMSGYMLCTPDQESSSTPPPASELHQYAVERADALLQHLTADPQDAARQAAVSTEDVPVEEISVELKGIVTSLKFMSQNHLTSTGFRFVLDDRQQQLWVLVTAILALNRTRGHHIACLTILLSLSDARVGQAFNFDTTLPHVEEFLWLLTDIGILYCEENVDGGTYIVTPAALALFRRDASSCIARCITRGISSSTLPAHLYVTGCLEAGAVDTSSEAMSEEQGVIVEANFKVYAYTTSQLHANLLGLFCRVVMRLPNVVVGHITAETVLRALKRGIRAENIIRYLESAAHPRAVKRAEESGGGIIPNNVRGQLEVWETNRARTTYERVVFFEWDPGEIDAVTFDSVRKRCEAACALLWASPARKAGNHGAGTSLGQACLAVRAEWAPRLREVLASLTKRKSRGAVQRPPLTTAVAASAPSVFASLAADQAAGVGGDVIESSESDAGSDADIP